MLFEVDELSCNLFFFLKNETLNKSIKQWQKFKKKTDPISWSGSEWITTKSWYGPVTSTDSMYPK